MKKLTVFLNTPAGVVIAVGLIVLVCEFSIMLLIEGVFNTIVIDKVPNIFWKFIDPLILIALISPALYILIFRPMRNQQAKLERQLDELHRNEQLTALIEAIPDAVFLKDGEGRWLVTNEPARQLFQLHNLPWQGKTEMELADLHPAFRTVHEGCLASDEKAWQAGRLLVGEESLAGEDGRCAIIETRKMPSFSKEGQRKRLTVIGRDITEHKRTEINLSENQRLLRELAAQDVVSQEAKYKHIAREVHDELGQILTALRIDTSLLRIQFSNRDPVLMKKIQDMQVLVDKAIQGVRNVAVNLRPPILDMGIIPAIAWLCDEFPKHTATVCTLRVVNDPVGLDDARTVAIFRIVQESLTNVWRYAAAHSVEITIWQCGDDIAVEVRDDGKGFDLATMPTEKSFGLLGMRERAIAVSGKVEIASALSKGTIVSVRIPAKLRENVL